MSATVEPAPLEDRTAPLPAVLAFTVKYDPSQPPGHQFSFEENGRRHEQLFLIDGPREVQITLDGELTFSSVGTPTGIHWLIPSSGLEVLDTGSQSRSILVQELPHDLAPVSFVLVVDAGGVKGILSPVIYLANSSVLQPGGLEVSYDPHKATFSLRDHAQAVLTLESHDCLVAVIPPRQQQCLLTFDLRFSQHTPDLMLEWAEQPVVWTAHSQPPWISVVPDGTKMTMMIEPSGADELAGFQFAVKVTSLNPPGEPLVVRSPDPILVNATIGDG